MQIGLSEPVLFSSVNGGEAVGHGVRPLATPSPKNPLPRWQGPTPMTRPAAAQSPASETRAPHEF